MFIDVEIGQVLSELLPDLLILMHAYDNLGNLCRHILRYYLFNNAETSLRQDIDLYKQSANENSVMHFDEYYGDKLLIVQGVYARLCLEIKRRNESGLFFKDTVDADIMGSLYTIAAKLKMEPFEFLTVRFYPFVAKWRERRLRQFYKAYTGKSLPKLNIHNL